MKIRSNIALKERRSFTMSGFRGVDLSASPLDVSPMRAILAENFICEYGVNRKRHGWNEIFRIKDSEGKGQAIGGIFPFRDKLIIHAGKRFYLWSGDGYTDITLSSTHDGSRVDPDLLTDKRTQCFYSKGKMYIIGCGDYLVYGSWDGGGTFELRRVYGGVDTAVPRTTVNIGADSVREAANEGGRSDPEEPTAPKVTETDIVGVLDDINLLTPWRKNGLVGMAAADTWTLDGSIDADTAVTVTVERAVEGVLEVSEYTSRGDELIDGDGAVVGSLDRAAGKLRMTVSTEPPSADEDNMTVLFCHEEGGGEAITKCEFGILFGVGGNTDRLFLAGNPDTPNVDRFSAMEDFTYFADGDYGTLGSDAAAIGGYGRLTDSTLVIYKEASAGEASLFYRTGAYKSYTDGNGNLDESRAVFPAYAGAAGECAVSRYACANFGGDSLMLSKNGVFGIVLSDNVSTVERNTRERSRLINEKLRKHDLKNAVAIVYDGRYYLAVDGVCYVADSRYRYQPKDAADGAHSYEWWYFTNIPARVFAVAEGKLYFGTADGRICQFDEQYTDRTYEASEAGDLGLDIPNGGFDTRTGLPFAISDGDEVMFETDGIYALYLDVAMVKERRIYVDEERIMSIYEGVTVYADHVGESGLAVGVPYKIIDVDRGDCSFLLADAQEEPVTLSAGGFRLVSPLSGMKLVVAQARENFFKVAERAGEEPFSLIQYRGSVPTAPTAVFTHKENVTAKWYTPVMDLGTAEYAKTLLSMTIVTEPSVNGKLSFGYETARRRETFAAKGLATFSFPSLSFKNFSFDTEFATSYTARVGERNFNFIMFRFLSDTDTDCAVNSFTVRYKLGKTLRGVK